MVATQRDFASPGGSEVLRNALLPDLQGQVSYNSENLLIGITAGYKILQPRLETDSLYKTTSNIGGITAQSFVKISTSKLIAKFQATYLQNGYDGLSIGGFAIKSITDPLRDYREYTTINTMNLWTDIHTTGNTFQFGLFAAYSQNLGTTEEMDDVSTISIYSRGWNIASIYRISPRITLSSGKTSFALEFEHTGAAYGDYVNTSGIPQDLKTQINNRILVAAYYFF